MNKSLCLSVVLALGLSACSADRVSNFPSYKLQVIQGNELDADALRQLKIGMTRQQVQILLGTPLLRDPLHRNRWDYVFTVSRNGVVEEERSLTLFFNEEDVLTEFSGDAMPKIAPAADTGKSL
ncbi:outer membrane protein assembly factor BamE [Stenoxybacter acetivorans]|uniref:outer membrane protein assembly factor BamE n=1 Tax=Stenoxybacter acetivorans TaxID=422441 RepID=UPI00055BD68A|nr:outer membrane protein assembly factor BamE [Stenoxybacter acetivorans]